MSAPKFTPGPWHVANGVQVRSERDQIAKVWMMRNGEGTANARLIAAAPELYEAAIGAGAALAAAISLLEGGGKKAAPSDRMFYQMLIDYNATLERVRATLAKARGEA